MAGLELIDVQKRYQGRTVLSDASMEVPAGTCVGIVGANGTGKSTLLGILAGMTRPDGGRALWNGADLLSDAALRRQTVGYVPQGSCLFEDLSARDNLLLWYPKEQLAWELEQGILGALGVGDFLTKRVSALSGGMKKRLSIGCAVARHPPLLLLDEPSTALDLRCKAELLAQLQSMRAGGVTLLLSTHDLQEIEACDRLYLLKDGTLRPCEPGGAAERLAELL